MRLGIAVALPQELKALTPQKINIGECSQIRPGLWVVLTGTGAQQAQSGGEKLLSKNIEAMISWGSAAALIPGLRAGDLVLPEVILGDGAQIYPTDPRLNEWLLSLPSPSSKLIFQKAKLYGNAPLLSKAQEKQVLHKETGAILADMESGALARLSAAHQIPFTAIRAIADTADMHLPLAVTKASQPNGQINILQFIWYTLLRPKDWILTIQLALKFSKTQKSLKSMGEQLVRHIP